MDDNSRIAAVAAFHEAVAIAKTQTAFGRAAGLLQQTVSNLLRRGDLLPPEAVIPTEKAFGISRHVLRPDIYPPAEAAVSSPAVDVAVEAGASIVSCDRSAGMKRIAGA